MDSKDKDTKTRKEGVYLSNFVAMGMAFFILVLAFAAGFFAKSYYGDKPLDTGIGTATGTPPAAAKAKTATEIFNLLPKITEADHLKGDKNAKIVLVVYSDFQCPFCASFHPTVNDFLAKYPDVALVFRNLPLDFHQFATERAKAGECAAKLGGPNAFWTYTDAVFGASDLNNVDLAEIGTKIGLNSASFDECIKSTEFDKRIADTSDGGKKFLSAISQNGGYGTPGAVIINLNKKAAEQLGGAVPLSALEAAYNKVK
jgi:protein-disulfide isomerase